MCAAGELQPRCRVGLPFDVDEAGMHAKFRKKLRSLSVTVPVLRDLRISVSPGAASFPVDGAERGADSDAARAGEQGPPTSGAPEVHVNERRRGGTTGTREVAASRRRVPCMAASLEGEEE